MMSLGFAPNKQIPNAVGNMITVKCETNKRTCRTLSASALKSPLETSSRSDLKTKSVNEK
jgi:hypothetical protein